MPPYLLADPEFRILHCSPAAAALFDAAHEAVPATLLEPAAAGLCGILRLAVDAAMRQGSPVLLDGIALGRGAGARHVSIAAEAVEIHGGQVVSVLFQPAEQGDPASAAEELGGFLRLLFEDTEIPLLLLDAGLTVRCHTPALRRLLGIDEPTAATTGAAALLGSLMGPGLMRDLHRVVRTGRQIERPLTAGALKDWQVKLIPAPLGLPDTEGGVALLFQRAGEAGRSRTGAAKLDHRVKNILGTAIAMASLMLEDVPPMQDFRNAYIRRIRALASANGLVAESDWSGTDLRSVIDRQIAPFLPEHLPPVVVDGPILILNPRAAVSLGMAVHEMASNAALHGALADPRMTLSIAWRREEHATGRLLVIEWIEDGGRGLEVAPEAGLGLTLIEQGIAHELSGEVRVEFTSQGVRYRISVPEAEAVIVPSGASWHAD